MRTPLFLLRLRRRLGAVCLAVLLASCGGGVDSGGTGATVQSLANGPITGFGSVIVAGIRFDDSAASVQDADGNARSRDELRLGMTLAVRGSAIVADADGHDAAAATSIVIGSAMVGRIAASNLAARTLTVFKETVELTNTTVFDDSLAGGQAALAVGDVVEIHAGFDAASGHHVATRVERKAAAAPFSLRGPVSALDALTHTLTLGATRIDTSALGAAAALANGALLRLVVAPTPASGPVWVALRTGSGEPPIDDRGQAKLEGLVSAFVSTAQFSVDGTPVDARSASFVHGTAGLAPGARVKVEGATRAGVLVASQVDVISVAQQVSQEFEVRGAISTIDTVAKSFVVRNVTVG